MSSDTLPLLSRGQRVDGTYQVGFLLNVSRWIQSYRVTDKAGDSFVLRLFTSEDNGRAFCAAQAKLMQMSDPLFAPALVTQGRHEIDGQPFYFLIQQHISGERLSERLSRLSSLSSATAKHIVLAILHGLDTLQTGERPIVCNNINCHSMMINMVSKEETYHLVDFDRAHVEGGHFDTDIEHHEMAYMATEAISGKGTLQSDLFSVGVILYRLLYGSVPWQINLSEFKLKSESIQQVVTKARANGVRCPAMTSVSDRNLFDTVQKALAENPSDRFQTAKDFIDTLEGKVKSLVNKAPKKPVVESSTRGFAAIAGMESLKETIKTDVIDSLNDREKYQRYGLDIPNGMLLYGPPGCGKTFFAERMAEEIGFHLFQLKPSDIQSKWVNAAQENIKQLFDTARANAPSIYLH